MVSLLSAVGSRGLFSGSHRRLALSVIFLCALVATASVALATSTYDYGADEYVTVEKGMSPDRKYAITGHGGSETREERFHIYLTNAATGKKIGPLEEMSEFLDTGPDAICAKWSKDSQTVTIIYRIDRHEPLRVYSYHIGDGRAKLLKGPTDATNEQTTYWGKQCGGEHPAPPEKVFGTSNK